MAQIRITRNIQFGESLINSQGERVNGLRLNGSFAINEFENEQYIYYDEDNDAWYLDTAGTGGSGGGGSELFLGDLLDVDLTGLQDSDVICFDQGSSTWVACDLISLIDANADCCTQNANDITVLQNDVSVLQGQVGGGGGGGGGLQFAVIDQGGATANNYSLTQASGLNELTARPNVTYYVQDLGNSVLAPFFLLPSNGSQNGGNPPVPGDRIRLQFGSGFTWVNQTNKNLRIGAQTGAVVGVWQHESIMHPQGQGYIETTDPQVAGQAYLRFDGIINAGLLTFAGFYIEFMCVEILGKVKWLVTSHSWHDPTGFAIAIDLS